MAEYVNIPVQPVLAGQNVVFTTDVIPCNKGLVMHRPGSGLFTLRGPGCACNQCFARYFVQFQGNLAVAGGGVVADGATVSIAVNGEALASSTATVEQPWQWPSSHCSYPVNSRPWPKGPGQPPAGS